MTSFIRRDRRTAMARRTHAPFRSATAVCASLFAGLMSTARVEAADANCGGTVSWAMADYPQCNGNLAFKTSGSGGSGGRWMCVRSKEGSSMVLAALVAGKLLEVYIEASDVGGNCLALPNYRNVSYVIINP